jgi:hypothetical protein
VASCVPLCSEGFLRSWLQGCTARQRNVIVGIKRRILIGILLLTICNLFFLIVNPINQNSDLKTATFYCYSLYIFFPRHNSPNWAKASSFPGIYNHTHLDTPQSVGLPCTSDQHVAETSTWQHTTITTHRLPCPWWESNPQTQQASGGRPTPETARPLGYNMLLYANTWT